MDRRSEAERTLARLGVEEIEERLEISPVVAGDDPIPADPEDGGCCCDYSCSFTPFDPGVVKW